jgi:two-component system LytT family response regulator
LPPALVFVTAYDQYALQAFEAGALDYLLKPFDNARFERTLRRAKEKIRAGKEPARVERVAIKNAGEVVFVKIVEIDWIEAADYYVCLHVGARTHLLRRSMTDVEQELDAGHFCRIHRSAIVNVERVRRLESGEDGSLEVVLSTGAKLRVSRRYGREVREKLVGKQGGENRKAEERN